MIHRAGLTLQPGFTLLFVNSKDNDSLFHALAILIYEGSHNHDVCRQDIVEYAVDHLFADQRYHGKNCKALARTVGRTMNMVPVMVSRKVCRQLDALTQLHVLNIIMAFVSETPVSYRKRMYQDSQNNGGTYRELVAAGRIFDCHINIIRPHMPMMRINPCGLDIDELS